MKKTPLYNEHINNNGKMIDFGGWLMTVQYSSIIKEHENTRNSVTLFDTCHMGEFTVEGGESLKFLNYSLSGDFTNLKDGKAKYSFLLNDNGYVIDDLIVFKFTNTKYLICVNAGTTEKDFAVLKNISKKFDIKLENISDKTGKIDIQGPHSKDCIKKLINANLPARFSFIECKINNIDVLLSRTGYTGEDGFELFFQSDKTIEIWKILIEAGKDFNISPAALGARDSLRLEAGYPLYGHELSEKITPLEAGLDFAVNLEKDDFIGKKALVIQKEHGVKRKLVVLEVSDKAIPREGYILFKDKKEIGIITSGTFSPTFKKGIAFAFVDPDIKTGDITQVKIRERYFPAIIKEKPLYKFKGAGT